MSSGSTIQVPEAVMERVHADLAKTILDSPEYINKIITELMKEPHRGSSYGDDPDRGKPLFERILRQELRRLIEAATIKYLREKYNTVIESTVAVAIGGQEKLEGSLAYAFAKLLEDSSWKVDVNVGFHFKDDK